MDHTAFIQRMTQNTFFSFLILLNNRVVCLIVLNFFLISLTLITLILTYSCTKEDIMFGDFDIALSFNYVSGKKVLKEYEVAL